MKYIWRDGWVPAYMIPKRAPSGPMVITDSHDAFQSQADGQFYESKSAYRNSLKEQGMIELGNETVKPSAPEPVLTAEALAESWDYFDARTNAGVPRDQVAKGADLPAEWVGEIE